MVTNVYGVTNATIPATLGEIQWIRVMAGSGSSATLSCPVAVTNTFAGCVCISDLTIQSKATIVELDWPLVPGATSYNVYRSKGIPDFPLVPEFLVARGVGGSDGLYVDGDLINGQRYYYRVSAVVGEVRTMRLNSSQRRACGAKSFKKLPRGLSFEFRKAGPPWRAGLQLDGPARRR